MLPLLPQRAQLVPCVLLLSEPLNVRERHKQWPRDHEPIERPYRGPPYSQVHRCLLSLHVMPSPLRTVECALPTPLWWECGQGPTEDRLEPPLVDRLRA